MSVGELTALLPLAAFAALAFGVLVVLRRAGRIVARTRDIEHFRSAIRDLSTRIDQSLEGAVGRIDAVRRGQLAADEVPPTIEAVYDEPDMAEAYPMKDTILEELKDAANRPLTPAYQNVSTVMSATLSPPSAIDPERTARELRDAVQDALDSKGVLP